MKAGQTILEKTIDFAAAIINSKEEHIFSKNNKNLQILEIIWFCVQRENDIVVLNEVATILMMTSDRLKCGKCSCKLRSFVSLILDKAGMKELALNTRVNLFSGKGIVCSNFALVFNEIAMRMEMLDYYQANIPKFFPLVPSSISNRFSQSHSKNSPERIKLIAAYPSPLLISDLNFDSKEFFHYCDWLNRRGFNFIYNIPEIQVRPLQRLDRIEAVLGELACGAGIIINEKGGKTARFILDALGYSKEQISQVELTF